MYLLLNKLLKLSTLLESLGQCLASSICCWADWDAKPPMRSIETDFGPWWYKEGADCDGNDRWPHLCRFPYRRVSHLYRPTYRLYIHGSSLPPSFLNLVILNAEGSFLANSSPYPLPYYSPPQHPVITPICSLYVILSFFLYPLNSIHHLCMTTCSYINLHPTHCLIFILIFNTQLTHSFSSPHFLSPPVATLHPWHHLSFMLISTTRPFNDFRKGTPKQWEVFVGSNEVFHIIWFPLRFEHVVPIPIRGGAWPLLVGETVSGLLVKKSSMWLDGTAQDQHGRRTTSNCFTWTSWSGTV